MVLRTVEAIELISACTRCGKCLDICPTYRATNELLFSPAERLNAAARLFRGEAIDDRSIESLYNCPKCMQCESICPERIPITRIIHCAREAMAEKKLGPLPAHQKVIEGILEKGNSVNGDPARRLDWLPETFPEHESDTLLYLGCLPSYLVKEAARSSYLVLKKLGVDFMILEDEGCCGTYLYESGRTDLAGEFFQKNADRFGSLGIRKIIVPCNGCLKCFKYFYPDLLGEMDFAVQHILEPIHEQLKQKPSILKKIGQPATYQDSCRLSRGEGFMETPREVLEWCGLDLKEMENNGNEAVCCGAGGGMRSVYRDLSLEIAGDVLSAAPAESVISACPFCTFNLNYAARKKNLQKTVTYFTTVVLQALE